MKKIHDMLKARKKHLHATHDIKHHAHTDFHPPIFGQSLFSKQGSKLSEIARALDKRGEKQVQVVENKKWTRALDKEKSGEEKKRAKEEKNNPRRIHGLFASQSMIKKVKASEDAETEGGGADALERERLNKLRELLRDIMEHPGTMTPHMFWVLFMKIAPHFSMMTAGCVRISALFWLMLSYVKAKNKTKKRKIKEQLLAAAELLEEEEASLSAKMRK